MPKCTFCTRATNLPLGINSIRNFKIVTHRVTYQHCYIFTTRNTAIGLHKFCLVIKINDLRQPASSRKASLCCNAIDIMPVRPILKNLLSWRTLPGVTKCSRLPLSSLAGAQTQTIPVGIGNARKPRQPGWNLYSLWSFWKEIK